MVKVASSKMYPLKLCFDLKIKIRPTKIIARIIRMKRVLINFFTVIFRFPFNIQDLFDN